MIAYKAVYKNMSSSYGNQPVYRTGVTYAFPAATRGMAGFHAAEDPLFCLSFISPSEGRYFKVELQGEIDPDGCASNGGTTAAAATHITFLEELSVEKMLWTSLQYRLAWAKSKDHRNTRTLLISNRKGQTVTADGSRSVAVANKANAVAIAQGCSCVAIAEGPNTRAEAYGNDALAVAYGKDSDLKVGRGAWGLRIDPTAPAGKQLTIVS